MRRLLPAILLFALWASATGASAEEPWPPWGAREPVQNRAGADDDFHLLRQGVRFFQNYISVVDGARCPMYPTCSAYALEALDRHGPILGTFLTVDRLIHETDPQEHGHPMIKYGKRRYYDPLANNDFWLEPSE